MLSHDVRRFGEVFDEFDVFPDLDLHQARFLLGYALFEERDVGANVEFPRLDENFHGEIQRIEEVLELEEDGIPFIVRFQRKVH